MTTRALLRGFRSPTVWLKESCCGTKKSLLNEKEPYSVTKRAHACDASNHQRVSLLLWVLTTWTYVIAKETDILAKEPCIITKEPCITKQPYITKSPASYITKSPACVSSHTCIYIYTHICTIHIYMYIYEHTYKYMCLFT